MEPTVAPPHAFYARTFALLTIGLLAYLLYQILHPFFAPITWAFFIAFLLHPAHSRLERKLGPSISAALLTGTTVVVVLGPLTALGAAFAGEVADLLKRAQEFATEHRPDTAADLARIPVLGAALTWLQDAAGISLVQVQAWAAEMARAVLKPLAGLGQLAVLGALGTLIGFVMMTFILFFAIRDGRAMFASMRDLIPALPAERTRLFDHLGAVTRAVVYGSGVTAVLQGFLIGVGFAIAGLPAPIVFGVLAGLLSLVPMAGTPVVWVPAVIALAIGGQWGMAVFLAVWGTLVATADNFVRPWLVSGRANIGTLTVFIGVLGGVSAFGPIGVVLGPLVLALAIALIRFTLEIRHAQPDSAIISQRSVSDMARGP